MLSRRVMTLTLSSFVLVMSSHACSDEKGAASTAQGGARSDPSDVDSRGDGDQSGTGPGGSYSVVVGKVPKVQRTPKKLRLKFLHLTGTSPGSGTDFQFLPGSSSDVLVTLRESKLALLHLEDRAMVARQIWTFKEQMLMGDACGPTNLLFDPKFASNHFIYVSYCRDNRTTRLVRYEFSEKTGPTSPSVIFETQVHSPELWRRFGSMGFEDEDILWMFVGDHALSSAAQDTANQLGSIVRFKPNREPDGEGYLPVNKLDWPGGSQQNTERRDAAIWAYGFRAPWRGTRDNLGRYWVGDVGDRDFEEVNLVTERGQNFGWDLYTGPCELGCSGSESPLVYYDRSDDHPFVVQEPGALSNASRAVWVGQIYQNALIDRYGGLMDDVVAFGDLFTGAIRGLRADALGKLTFNQPIAFLPYVTQWRVGPDGYVYVLDLGGNMHVAVLSF